MAPAEESPCPHGVLGDRGNTNHFGPPQTQAHAEPWMNKTRHPATPPHPKSLPEQGHLGGGAPLWVNAAHPSSRASAGSRPPHPIWEGEQAVTPRTRELQGRGVGWGFSTPVAASSHPLASAHCTPLLGGCTPPLGGHAPYLGCPNPPLGSQPSATSCSGTEW